MSNLTFSPEGQPMDQLSNKPAWFQLFYRIMVLTLLTVLIALVSYQLLTSNPRKSGKNISELRQHVATIDHTLEQLQVKLSLVADNQLAIVDHLEMLQQRLLPEDKTQNEITPDPSTDRRPANPAPLNETVEMEEVGVEVQQQPTANPDKTASLLALSLDLQQAITNGHPFLDTIQSMQQSLNNAPASLAENNIPELLNTLAPYASDTIASDKELLTQLKQLQTSLDQNNDQETEKSALNSLISRYVTIQKTDTKQQDATSNAKLNQIQQLLEQGNLDEALKYTHELTQTTQADNHALKSWESDLNKHIMVYTTLNNLIEALKKEANNK